jgi:hypothetical protein
LIISVYSGISPQKGYSADEDQGLMRFSCRANEHWFILDQWWYFSYTFYEISSPIFKKITIQLNPKYYPEDSSWSR